MDFRDSELRSDYQNVRSTRKYCAYGATAAIIAGFLLNAGSLVITAAFWSLGGLLIFACNRLNDVLKTLLGAINTHRSLEWKPDYSVGDLVNVAIEPWRAFWRGEILLGRVVAKPRTEYGHHYEVEILSSPVNETLTGWVRTSRIEIRQNDIVRAATAMPEVGTDERLPLEIIETLSASPRRPAP